MDVEDIELLREALLDSIEYLYQERIRSDVLFNDYKKRIEGAKSYGELTYWQDFLEEMWRSNDSHTAF